MQDQKEGAVNPPFPSLLRKAAGDAGFDLEFEVDSGWQHLGVSGVPGSVWVQPHADGAMLALATNSILSEFDRVSHLDAPLPPGATGAVACNSPDALFRALRRVRLLLAHRPPLPEQRLEERIAAITTTETEAIVRQRVGQDLFREALMEYWEGCCAVTGLAVPELLRASHAKPWKDSTDRERLDVHNGFLLAVHIDALFDRGLLTFEDDGKAVFSSALPPNARMLLIGEVPLRLPRVAEGHKKYLDYHREHLFKRDQD